MSELVIVRARVCVGVIKSMNTAAIRCIALHPS